MSVPAPADRRISYAALCSGIYAVFGVVWITASDRVAALLIPETAQLSDFQTLKGWAFVLGTAALIFILLRAAERRSAPRAALGQAPWAPSGPATPGLPVLGQLVLLVLAVSLPLCGLLAWSIYRSAEEQVEGGKRLVADLVSITARDVSRTIAETERTMTALAGRPQVRALDPQHCDPVMSDVAILNNRFINVMTFDAEGRPVCSVLPVPPAAGLWYPRSAQHRRIQEGARFVLSSPMVGGIAGEPIVLASAPLRETDGRIKGSINFSLSLESLRPVVRPVLPRAGTVGIINSEGRVVYGDSPQRRGADASEIEAVRVALRQKNGDALAHGYDGVQRSYQFAQIDGTDWIAIAGLPTALLYGEARASAWRNGLIGLAIILLAAAAGTWMSRRIARPVLGIAEAARRAAEGDFAARAPEGGAREVTAVARQFNRMLDQLPLVQGELFESEQRYKNLFDTSPECVFVHAEGRIVMINRAGARIYGAESPEAMVGMRVADLAHPDDRAEVERRVHTVTVERRELAPRELKNVRLDGTPIIIEVMSLPFEYLGRPAVLTQLRDITARKEAEARAARLANLYFTLSRTNEAMVRETGRAGLCDAVCRIMVEQGGFITAGIRLHDQARAAYVPVASHGPTRGWVGERVIPDDDSGSRVVRAVQSGTTYVLNDIMGNPDGNYGTPDMRILGIKSLAILPIMIDGRGIGGVSAFAGEVGVFTPDLVRLLEEMVRNLAFALVKLEGEQALADSESRYRALIEAAPDAIGVLVGGRVALANSAAVRLYAAPGLDALIGRTGFDLVAPELHGGEVEVVRQMVHNPGMVTRVESRHVRFDGSIFDAEVVRSRFEYRGQPALQAIVRDISERKAAERRIGRLTQLYSALSKTNEAVARAAGYQDLCATVCRVAVDYGGFVTALIATLDDAGAVLTPAGAHGRLVELIGAMPMRIGEDDPGMLLATAVREGRVMVSNDVKGDTRLRVLQEHLASAGVGAIACCPLAIEGRVAGVLIVYGDAPDYFDEEILALLAEMTRNIAFGLSKLQGEEIHRLSEAALRDSEARYRRLFNTSPVCIYVRQDDRVVMVNPAGVRLFGAQGPEDIIGQPVTRLVPPEYHEMMEMRHATVLGEGRPSPAAEFKNMRLDGTVLDTESIVTPFEFAGRPALQVIVSDITARKQAERALRRLNTELEQRVQQRTAELEKVNQELSEFSYIVSHDLKAPLRGVASLVNWLEQDHGEALGPDGRELLRLLSTRSRRMHRLIEDILYFSRLGRGRETTVEVDLGELVAEVADSLALPAGIELRVGPLPVVTGDETRLRQVFQNLISNAVKFMDKPAGLIEIGAEPVEGEPFWRFHVADNGPGIDPRHHQRIFEIFQTLTPRDDPDSTGIGLTVVKKIVEILKGGIWVESELGKGARFVFTLPRRDASDVPQAREAYEGPDAHPAGGG